MDALLKVYLPKPVYEHVITHFHELGALAGGELDEAAMVADKNPPVLTTRNRAGEVEYTVHKHPAYVRLKKQPTKSTDWQPCRVVQVHWAGLRRCRRLSNMD